MSDDQTDVTVEVIQAEYSLTIDFGSGPPGQTGPPGSTGGVRTVNQTLPDSLGDVEVPIQPDPIIDLTVLFENAIA